MVSMVPLFLVRLVPISPAPLQTASKSTRTNSQLTRQRPVDGNTGDVAMSYHMYLYIHMFIIYIYIYIIILCKIWYIYIYTYIIVKYGENMWNTIFLFLWMQFFDGHNWRNHEPIFWLSISTDRVWRTPCCYMGGTIGVIRGYPAMWQLKWGQL